MATYIGSSVNAGSVMTANQPPVIMSVSATAANPGEDVMFMVVASDADGDALVYAWDFGDGATASSTAGTAVHCYALAGTYTVTVTVSDGQGGTDTAALEVRINVAPVAEAGGDYVGTVGRPVTLDGGGSYDPDKLGGKSTLSYTWDFGDGTVGYGKTASHSYTAVGTYTVTLTVNDGLASATDVATVVVGPSLGIELAVRGYKVKGRRYVDLMWLGAGGTRVEIIRNGAPLLTTENDGFYVDTIGNGVGTYEYQVSDGENWSNTARVTF